jgi:hypothetical protein
MDNLKGAREDCISFYDVETRVGINVVPFSKVTFCPRVGDTVELPGESGAGKGIYEVVSVYHGFAEDASGDIPARARVMVVRIDVKIKATEARDKSHLSHP